MTLDNLLSNLTKRKNGERNTNPKYDSKLFSGVAKGLGELEKIDITTVEGLKKYTILTGDDPSKYSQEEIKYRKDIRSEGGQSDLSAYVTKHFNNILGELNKETQIDLGFRYCPEKDIKEKYEKYNTTRKIVSNAKKTLEKIRDNPQEYLTNQMKKESPLMIDYIIRYKEEFMQIKQKEAQINGQLAIAHYDASKFLKLTKQNLDKQVKILEKKSEEIGKAIKTKLEIEETNNGRILSATRKADLTSDKRKELENLYKTHSDAQTLEPFRQDVASYAIQTIEARVKKAAEAKQNQTEE